MRRLITFACKGTTLVGTLDSKPDGAPGSAGVLIVSGGNEVRHGAHRGMATLARRLAEAGVPVFRFDRRGVGDSAGESLGWAGSAPDIQAAAKVFAAELPHLDRVLGFGNCDAASALAVGGRGLGVDAVVLANPWLREETDALPPAAAIGARYREKLASPAEWKRLATGGVDLRKLAGGLAKLGPKIGRGTAPDALADKVLAGIRDWGEDATVVLAKGDATGLAYADAARDLLTHTVTLDTASHSFADAGDQLFALLRRAATRRPRP